MSFCLSSRNDRAALKLMRGSDGEREALIVGSGNDLDEIVFLSVVLGDFEGVVSGAIVPNQQVKMGDICERNT